MVGVSNSIETSYQACQAPDAHVGVTSTCFLVFGIKFPSSSPLMRIPIQNVFVCTT